MIDLSLPLHVDWLGGLSATAYLDRLSSLGVTAVEIQLPPSLSTAEIERWTALIDLVRERQLKLAIHVPIAPEQPVWPELRTRLARVAQSPLTLILHGCTAGRPSPALYTQTIVHIRALFASVPNVVVAVELGWNWGTTIGVSASLHRLRGRHLRQRRQAQRPSGVGSGMGGATPTVRRSQLPAISGFDPPLGSSLWRTLRRADGFSGTGTREDGVIAWDLAHDWLGGAQGGIVDWRSTPADEFLRLVGYVRLHDVDDRGCDHWPLVVGNVPYASQLRSLLRHDFNGTVCLAIRYTPQMLAFGDRWRVLERSLAVTRQVLRLN
jgi:hypothetical protein